MSGTPSALDVLNEGIVEIESTMFSIYESQENNKTLYLMIRLQSGMSRPSSAIAVANFMEISNQLANDKWTYLPGSLCRPYEI